MTQPAAATAREPARSRTPPAQTRAGTPARAETPSLLTLRRCACGGGCPRCRANAAHPQLAINTPGDTFEREAERAADAVMSASPAPPASAAPARMLRRCACGGSCPACGKEKEEALHREDAGAGNAPGFAPPVVHQVLASPGRPLDAAARGRMEEGFGADFSAVRVHDDARAAESARAVDAHAYTVGSDIVFASGRYAPGTAGGDRLLAHELAHTLQQVGVTRRLQRACGVGGIGTPAGCTPKPADWISGYPVYQFDQNCDTLASGQQAQMLTNAPSLPANIEVHGYASTDGDATFNQRLACARARRARKVLTDPVASGGAALAPARIIGVFTHGATPGPATDRRSVVLAPPAPTPTPVPATVPPPGATDFRIERVGRSTRSRIFFARGSSTLDADAVAAIALIKGTPPASVSLVGYASTDEPAAVAQARATAVETALTAAPSAVPVTSATGNAPATVGRSDFTASRSVEVVLPGAAPATLDCSTTVAKGPCPTIDPATQTAFTATMPVALDAMSRAVASVAGAPNATDAPVIDRFFGNHDPATLTALRTNLARLQAHVVSLPGITSCANECEKGSCGEGSTIAYNHDVDAASTMTLCVPTFRNNHLNDRARNLIHESAHGTTPLGGPTAPTEGTTDLAYRHERMLFQLSPADRLRNSDNYALFAMFLREVQMTGSPSAAPAGISTPATDTLVGLGADQPALELALARLEKRMTWSEDWMGQLYGELRDVRAGTQTWAASWARNLMREASTRFPLTAPTTPSTTTLTDELRLASILERYRRMKSAVKRNLTVTRMPTGVVVWTSGPGAWIANPTFSVGPDFFLATADHQVMLLHQALAGATRDVEPAYLPAYVSLSAWIHAQNP